ncbi:phosphotransferase family protein [Amycolatopsis sp. K13G38]|uniref:Phosphotransferase family protein n=1 Tax=Amycolatopsis acididurans TaxID=2724524 RepID=A0ABX1JBL1_9PSEU|nr:phosphotransferase family protein [Amycolatopsis acididurans]NKQ57068.1 phosphotransferase family protein [Amycolatopsis acididurans]
MVPKLSARPAQAVPPVDRAIEAALSGLPAGAEQAAAVRELGASLRHRAVLDDQVRERRILRLPEITGTAARLWSSPPGKPDELFEAVFNDAPALVGRAATAAEDAGHLARLVEWLIETDLAQVPNAVGDDERSGAAEQVQPAPTVSAGELLACLRKQARAGEVVHAVSNVRVLSGGFSKEMLTAAVEYGRGARDVVIRKVAKGRTAHTLAGEFAALSFAWQHRVPVPEPLWLDESALGQPAFATGMSAGRCVGDVWGPSQPVDRRTAERIAAVLARLHSLDTSSLTSAPLPPMCTRDEIAGAVDERRQVLDAVAEAADPYAAVFALVLAWLREHVPGDVARPVLVHGDFGLHNILIEGTAPTAVLDWERAHLGDPAEDLAYVRPSVEPILPWEEFLRAYQDAGGPRPDPRRLAYYRVWHDAWRGVSAYRLRAKFVADPARISDAVAGLLMSPRFLLRAAHSAFGPAAKAC